MEEQKVAAWFLGPKAENEKVFCGLVGDVLHQHSEWRREYFSQDPVCITDTMQDSEAYQEQIFRLKMELNSMSQRLRNSMPFFSPRYKAHMVFEPSMIGMLGYFAGMLYNQNNVAAEGSTVTSPMEVEVGQDLCKIFGFDIDKSFAHLTSSGSVANFDSLWAARNVKYLAYALRRVLDNDDARLDNLRDTTKVTAANGVEHLIFSLDPTNPEDLWTLYNIPVVSTLDLYDAFLADHEMVDFVRNELTKYSVTDVGMQNMPGNTGCYCVPASAHYSHPKGGALMGIGQNYMIRISLDKFGRMELEDLEKRLNHCLEMRQPVFQVVAVIGTTAEGAVDNIVGIIALRRQFRKKGLDFFLHADAAWGGYFCTMLESKSSAEPPLPSFSLSNYVETQLRALGSSDSITIDPHKSGYIQYPAGAICFSDQRIKHLLAYITPYLVQQENQAQTVPDYNVGLFGIDGSRPGAAASATLLHHRVVGLGPSGHGRLMEHANYASKMYWSAVATLASPDDPFVIGQIHQPPSNILNELRHSMTLSYEELVHNNHIMEAIKESGPDMLIDTFIVNYKTPLFVFQEDTTTQTLNKSLDNVNRLVGYIATDLNMFAQDHIRDWRTMKRSGANRKGLLLLRNKMHTAVNRKSMESLIQSTQLECPSKIDYHMDCLVITTMEPWPTYKGFLDVFKGLLRQSVLRNIGRVTETVHVHGFIIADAIGGEVFGDYLPIFTDKNSQYHLIVKLAFEDEKGEPSEKIKAEVFQKYNSQLAAKGGHYPLGLTNSASCPMAVHDLLYSKSFKADVWCWANEKEERMKIGEYNVHVTDIILNYHFDPADHRPATEKYYVYGVQGNLYASHRVYKRPDYHHIVKLASPPLGASPTLIEFGFEVCLINVLGGNHTNHLKAGQSYAIEFTSERNNQISSSLVIEKELWLDSHFINILSSFFCLCIQFDDIVDEYSSSSVPNR